jgi:hypothetical protein
MLFLTHHMYLAADGPKKEVRFAVDMALSTLLGKPQRAPIKLLMGTGGAQECTNCFFFWGRP